MAGIKVVRLIFALTLLNTDTTGSHIYEHNLLAIHNSSTGIQFTLTQPDGNVTISEQVSSYYLPPECGEKFSRCKDLLVLPNELNENVTQFVAVIPVTPAVLPVTPAVLLLDVRHNGSALLHHNSFIVNQTIEDCNPTAIFKIAKSIYTMCYNERTSFLTVIELRIRDLGSIQKAFFARPTLRGGKFYIANEVSNFLSIGIVNSTGETYVVFTSGSTLTAYAPINTVMYPTDIDIPCSPKRIEHASGGVVVAYCSDRSVSTNIVSQEMNITFYNESGYPFFCPNYPHIKLSAFHTNQTYLRYQVLQGSQNFTKVIPITGDGNSFDDSQCFGTGTTYFAYSDNKAIHVVNTTSGREFDLSSYGYLNPSCLSIIGGRYLIVQEQAQNGTDAISIFDSQQNLAEVVRTHNLKANLVAVIRTSRSIEPSLNPTPTITEDISTLLASTPQTTPVVPTVTPTDPVATAVSIPVVVVLVVVVAVVIAGIVGGTILILKRYRVQGKRYPLLLCCQNRIFTSVPRPVQEEGDQQLLDVYEEHEGVSLSATEPCSSAESDPETSSMPRNAADRSYSEASLCISPSEQEPNNEHRPSQLVPGTL